MHFYLRFSIVVLIITANCLVLKAQRYSLVAPTNVIHIHAENELCLAGTNASIGSFGFNTDNGVIEKEGGRLWIIPSHTGKTVVIMYRSVYGKRKVLTRFIFKAVTYPVHALVGTLTGGAVHKRTLLAMGGLRAYAEGFECQPLISVTSYDIVAMRGVECLGATCNIDIRFKTETTLIIGALQPGDKLLFYNIEACINNEQTVSLTPLEFTIID